jgi:ABC-type multidrug transport system permease subunit
LHGTPLPSWVFIAGRIISAVWVSMIAVAVLVGVGVAFYGVQVVWHTGPAVLLTLLVGIACFAALGLAVVSLVSSANAVQGITNGTLILLAFFSGMFVFGDLPEWVEPVGWFFPLRHFAVAVSDAFNPYLTGAGFAPDHLAVMSAWGIGAALVAWRFWTWEPRTRRRTERRTHGRPGAEPTDTAGAHSAGGTAHVRAAELARARRFGRPGAAAVVAAQTRYAVRQIVRDPMSLFFGMAFPVLLLVFFGSTYGSEATFKGLPLAQYVAPAFAIYGIGVMAYVNLAGAIAEQRARLTLKRLRGTPLPTWAYFGGRLLAPMLLGLLTAVIVFAVGIVLFGVTLPPATWPATLFVFVVSIVCFAALGLMIASIPDSPQTVIAIALATLLPLSFVSDIFLGVDQLPAVMNAVGWTFPLRHAVAGAVTAASGGALDAVWWGHIGVVVLWAVIGAAVAQILFRWEPRR